MCCCGKPTINGEPGCKMTFDGPTMVYAPNPPALAERDALLFDERSRHQDH